MAELKVEYVPLGELHPYAKNPRGNIEAIEYVGNSIQAFGFRVPIVIDHNKTIVAGETRFLAAKAAGMGKVPCVIADDLTEDQINAFRLVDNKTHELSSWDFATLLEELAGVDSFDMTLFGFARLEPSDIEMEDVDRGNANHVKDLGDSVEIN